MITDTVLIRSPNTHGPIELYLKYQLLKRGGTPLENGLVDELYLTLLDEEGRPLLDADE